MGSGKSAVAQALGRILECVALDLDYEITHRERRGPKEIIETDGEPAFREIETQTLSKVLKEVVETDAAHVIALGGGTFTIARNREIIQTHNCHTVWLDVPFALCWKRILSSGDERPLARNKSEASSLYRERHDSYRRAELHVEASENTSADQIAEEIAQALSISDVESRTNEKQGSA